jgi:tetratricopeptide (TPR) repeat protein
MRRLLQEAEALIEGFVDQRDDYLLALSCRDLDVPVVLKMIDGVDRRSTHVFWSFAPGFRSGEVFTAEVLSAFRERYQAIAAALEAQQIPAWPPLPDDLGGAGTPAERLTAMMSHARSLLPATERLVVALLPASIDDPVGWAQLLSGLLQHDRARPWWRGMRVLVRLPEEDQPFRPALLQARRVRLARVDFSPERLGRSIEETAADASAPLPERMQCLLQLAMLDQSHRRYLDAIEKYKLLLKYHQAYDNKTMVALVLNGMGEVCLRSGNTRLARRCLESALTPALAAEATPVLLNITLNLGNLHLQAESWEEAARYYDSAFTLASRALLAETTIQCLENVGVCRLRQGDLAGAAVAWDEAARLARGVEEPGLLRNCLVRLRDIFGDAGLNERQERVVAELQALG